MEIYIIVKEVLTYYLMVHNLYSYTSIGDDEWWGLKGRASMVVPPNGQMERLSGIKSN